MRLQIAVAACVVAGVLCATQTGCGGPAGQAAPVVVDLSGENGQPVSSDYFACRIPAAWSVAQTANDRLCRCPEGFAKATETIKVFLKVSRENSDQIAHRMRGYVESFGATVSTVVVDGRECTRALKPFTAPATRKTTWEYVMLVPDLFVLVTDPMDETTKDGLVPYLDAIVQTLTLKSREEFPTEQR